MVLGHQDAANEAELVYINDEVRRDEAEAFCGHLTAAAMEMPPDLPGDLRDALARLFAWAEQAMIDKREAARASRGRLRAAGLVQ